MLQRGISSDLNSIVHFILGIKKSRKAHIFLCLALTVMLHTKAGAQLPQQSYNWKNVQIHGGGFVDGVIYHPSEKDLMYCRTDMGGAYKWNAVLKNWEPLLDWVAYKDNNLMGVESIALDPANPNRLYMACGTYTASPGPNAILLSANRGKTFKRVDVPFKMGGNENGRGNGERMAVDPNNGDIIYMGTRIDGLWKSEDRAATWTRVSAFPFPVNQPAETTAKGTIQPKSNGIIFIIFDGNSRLKNRSAILYAGISGKEQENIYRSIDGGQTWLPLPGQPAGLMPTHGILAADGMLYISYSSSPGPDVASDGAVYKYDPQQHKWRDITPVKPQPETQKGFGYAAVAVDARHPETIIASTYHRYGKAGGEDIFRSLDGGQSWHPIFTGSGGGKLDYSSAPYIVHTGIHWLFDLEIDPFDSNHAIFTTGYGLHETFDLTDADHNKPTTWRVMNNGIEETVGLDLLSPPKGVALISAIGDYGGFVHHNLDTPAPEGNFTNPSFSNTNSISCAVENGDIIARVGESSGINFGYSLNGGKSWQAAQGQPQSNSKGGSVCVSASGKSWIWTPQKSVPYKTSDRGATWVPIDNLPVNTRVIADQVNPSKFYAMDLYGGKLYISIDSGSTFSEYELWLPNGYPKRANRGDNRGGQDQIYATPGKEGDLWIAAFDGLYRSNGGDFRFAKMDQVTEIHAFGFGKAAPKRNFPALFLAGTVRGKDGIFRSDDAGETWVCINDTRHRLGLILQITGDPKKYGRVYVGTHGRGIFYGDIN